MNGFSKNSTDEFENPDSHMNKLSAAIIGAAIEVHRILGPGFLESVYEAALAREMELRGIKFKRQHPVGVMYKDAAVGEQRLDFLVEEMVVIELKAVQAIDPIHSAIVMSYLKATGKHLGLILNFNVRIMVDGVKRVVLK